MNPVCVECQLLYRMKKSGFYFIEGMPKNGVTADQLFYGPTNNDCWQPYKVWVGDLWQCRGCGSQIISGVAQAPVSDQYKDDFAEVIEYTRAHRLMVKDC